MGKALLIGAALLVGATQAPAGSVPEKVILETWDAAYLGGARAGYVHTIVRESEQNKVAVQQTSVQYRLQVKRFKETIHLGTDIADAATADGKVFAVGLRQTVGKEVKADVRGQVVGKQLHLKLADGKKLDTAPWDANVVGLAKQQTLFRDRQVQPGDSFSYPAFEPTISLVVTTRVKVVGYESVEPFPGKERQKLLRVDLKPDPVQGLQLPGTTVWLDDQREVVRSQQQLPIGQLTLYRTTKTVAMQSGGAGAADIATSQLIRLNRKIANPYAVKKAVYRVKVKDADNPAGILSPDPRQVVSHMKKGSFELTITAGASAETERPGDEFTQSSYFIKSDDPLVQKLARQAVGPEKDAWRQALRIEKWVNRNMKATSSEAMDPADQVAKTLRGDCSEYAMLMAAMCRAEGIPARIAMGLIYADSKGKGPVFSFHMWTEVWADGRWQPLDATLGRGQVGATHLKIADHSWHQTQALTPLLPLYNLLGKLSIEVIRVEY